MAANCGQDARVEMDSLPDKDRTCRANDACRWQTQSCRDLTALTLKRHPQTHDLGACSRGHCHFEITRLGGGLAGCSNLLVSLLAGNTNRSQVREGRSLSPRIKDFPARAYRGGISDLVVPSLRHRSRPLPGRGVNPCEYSQPRQGASFLPPPKTSIAASSKTGSVSLLLALQ